MIVSQKQITEFEPVYGEVVQVVRIQFQCSRCHAYVRQTEKFCGNCGAVLA